MLKTSVYGNDGPRVACSFPLPADSRSPGTRRSAFLHSAHAEAASAISRTRRSVSSDPQRAAALRALPTPGRDLPESVHT
eukprot:6178664-Pleurochrysis_carterae.AAC.3